MVAAINHQTDEPLLAASAWLAAAHEIAWDCATDQEILEAVVELEVIRNQADALAGKLAVASERGPVQRDGCRKASIWIGKNTNSSPAQCRADIRVTKWLTDYPVFRDAYESGVLSRDHVDCLRKAERPSTRLKLIEDQEMLVGFARDVEYVDFPKVVQYWINAADPDGTIPDEQVRNNRIRLRRRSDGSGTIDAELDPLLMTLTHEAIEREIKRLRTVDEETGVRRPMGELRAEAWANLVRRGAQRADGTTTSPLINIVLGLKLAGQLLASQVDPDTEITPRFDDPDHRCELIDGTPLHPKLALALLGIAEMRRMVMEAPSRKPDVSLNTRHFPQWMRDYGLVRTRGKCAEPGCDAPFHWLQADHIKPHAKGGQTRLDNEQPLCEADNHAKSDTWTEPDDPDSPAA